VAMSIFWCYHPLAMNNMLLHHPYPHNRSRGWPDPAVAIPLVDVSNATLEAAQASARTHLLEMGIRNEELGIVDAKYLVFERSDQPGEAFVHGVHVYVDRQLGGYEVVGHRAVLEFTPSGELLAADVKWPAIDLARSALTMPGDGSCSPAGLRSLRDDLATEALSAARYYPVLLPAESPSTGHAVTVRLSTVALFESRGADGRGRPTMLDCGHPGLLGGTP